jgi:hypothetical protein
MFRLNSEITIGNLKFNFVTNLQIKKSWETLTDTAMIELPNKLYLKNTQIKDIIKVNDPVTIKIGYFPDLITRFTGYVSKVVPDSPLKIMCEDEAFKLKQISIKSYSKNNVTLQQLITDNYSGEVNIVDANLGAFRISNATLIQVLQEIRNKYKLYSWFRDGVLYSGVPFIEPGDVKKFHFQRNVISHNLEWQDEEDLKTIAHGVSKQSDGKTLELYVYYKDGVITTTETKPFGNLNTMKIPNVSRTRLEELLKRWLPNLTYTGYKGSFECFGLPIVNHGDVARLKDLKFPERDGDYLIRSVTIDFGQKGYRQNVELFRIIT